MADGKERSPETAAAAEKRAGAVPDENSQRPNSAHNRHSLTKGRDSVSGNDATAANRAKEVDRARLVRERQNEERQRKLEELREQALAAQRFREQREEDRRRRIEELRIRDFGRRSQVEERKRMIWEAENARREAILRKNQEREARIEAKRKNERSHIVFAFGSSTPRMLEPADTGGSTSAAGFWGTRRATSTSNVMSFSVMAQPLTRRSSERELDGSKKRATSAGGLDRKPGEGDEGDSASVLSAGPGGPAAGARFPNRRRTDLMPTIPSPRDCSGASISGRSSSAKSFTRSPGVRSGEVTPNSPSRPHSSMSQQSATSSVASSSVNLRPRTATGSSTTPRRPRPASIAGTGVTSGIGNNANEPKSAQKDSAKPPLPKVHSVAKKPSSSSAAERRSVVGAVGSNATAPSSTGGSGISRSARASPRITPRATPLQSPGVEQQPQLPTVESSREQLPSTATTTRLVRLEEVKPKEAEVKKSLEEEQQKVVVAEAKETESAVVEQIAEKIPDIHVNDQPASVNSASKKEDVTSIESHHQQQQQQLVNVGDSAAHPEEQQQQQLQPENLVVEEQQPQPQQQPDKKVEAVKAEKKPTAEPEAATTTTTTTKSEGDLDEQCDMTASMIQKIRITTEEEAKAALAERRRLAREQAEREAELERQRQEEEARLEAERLQAEEEAQRRLEEETLRLANEAREAEEQRLRLAIEEAQKREEEDRKRREEEARQKLEKEEAERKAREEAEKQRLEMVERLKKEEEERNARRKRVEAIMSRTRAKNQPNTPNKGDGNDGDKSKEESPSDENKPSPGEKTVQDLMTTSLISEATQQFLNSEQRAHCTESNNSSDESNVKSVIRNGTHANGIGDAATTTTTTTTTTKSPQPQALLDLDDDDVDNNLQHHQQLQQQQQPQQQEFNGHHNNTNHGNNGIGAQTIALDNAAV